MAETKQIKGISDGAYVAQPDGNSVVMGLSEDKQTEMISVRVILDDGRRLTWRGNFKNQQAIDITVAALVTMGWDQRSRIGMGPDDLRGLGSVKVEIVVSNETYDGKTMPKVAFVNPLGGMQFKGGAIGQSALDKLNERVFRQMSATAPKQAPAKPHEHLQAQPTARQAAPPQQWNPTGAILSDEDRARAIDRGEDTPPRPAPPSEEGEPEEQLPF
jgi:hypothetical protein